MHCFIICSGCTIIINKHIIRRQVSHTLYIQSKINTMSQCWWLAHSDMCHVQILLVSVAASFAERSWVRKSYLASTFSLRYQDSYSSSPWYCTWNEISQLKAQSVKVLEIARNPKVQSVGQSVCGYALVLTNLVPAMSQWLHCLVNDFK